MDEFRSTAFVSSAGKPLVSRTLTAPVDQGKDRGGRKVSHGLCTGCINHIHSRKSLANLQRSGRDIIVCPLLLLLLLLLCVFDRQTRDVALNAKPYTDAIFDAVQALVAHTHITHPIAVKDEKNPRGCSLPHFGSW